MSKIYVPFHVKFFTFSFFSPSVYLCSSVLSLFVTLSFSHSHTHTFSLSLFLKMGDNFMQGVYYLNIDKVDDQMGLILEGVLSR